ARKCAGRLSDDAIRLIHSLDRDNWNNRSEGNSIQAFGHEIPKSSSIFLSILKFATQILTPDGEEYKVKFQHLFKWRDITRLVGEDIFIVSRFALNDAYSYRGSARIGERISYPPSLRNDNPDIKALIDAGTLHELHCHLNATANIFNINWVCLMNNPQKRLRTIKEVVRKLDDKVDEHRCLRIHELLIQAARFRFRTCQYFNGMTDEKKYNAFLTKIDCFCTENEAIELSHDIQAYRILCNVGDNPDYITVPGLNEDCHGDFRVYLGERYFLYQCMLHVLRKDNRDFAGALRHYLLVKAIFRKEMIQLNRNHGFSNFKRYQDVKSMFLRGYPEYQRMLGSLAVGDAWRDSNIAYQEVRIAPQDGYRKGLKSLQDIRRYISSELEVMSRRSESERKPDVGIIYHFIKLKEKDDRNPNKTTISSTPRNHNIRKRLRKQSYIIRALFRRRGTPQRNKESNKESNLPKGSTVIEYPVKGIDAASSEFNCRPEVFGQAFRFLKSSGLKATFHAGEDFYDIADGLRAIDEAVTFLGMTSGDRIGHAIAMGVDARKFYSKRENHVIVPAQWMLDNVAWLLFRSGEWNITIEPTVESFLRTQYNNLFSMIYGGRDSDYIPVESYYQSLLLRGDNPDWYRKSEEERRKRLIFSDSWDAFELLDSVKAATARNDGKLLQLYASYHFDRDVRKRGDRVIEFKVCKGYCNLIESMQEKMIHRLERKHIIIESCPSSNLLIGSLDKYRNHPAFRFYSVDGEKRNHLKVTLNTDDLGVFQTSLANEYSYMALALSKERDDEGNPVYMPHIINEWLKVIAGNGENARF
nr:hypothetical protein [Muribaculaceae bacterium]